ncbi:hypothetical protein FD754_021654 [Muntiacus muntjak]|uniref:60S ribosomal protein L13a n=1 Tax=Muntiacus muntjak TaxID=9888 RepID=A0A5N3V700_MUNMU|nr:hypothetical protein FD754_021654 [Muntiacus muntjak]
MHCKGTNISGNFHRNKLKYLAFLCKQMNTNPSHGSYHFGVPSHIFWRTMQSILPHKTKRSQATLDYFKIFIVCLKPTRKSAYLGCLALEGGWNYQVVTVSLVEKRKAKIHYRKKQQLMRLWKQAEKNIKKKTVTEVLEIHGFMV